MKKKKPHRLDEHRVSTEKRGNVQRRLLICDTCRAVWPTERDEAHGGSRSDGEPCAYRWAGGRVCRGRVHPYGWVHKQSDEAGWTYEHWHFDHGGSRFDGTWMHFDAARGSWADVLEVPRGTKDIALVRRKYRELAMKHHPDVGGTHEKMRDLNEAYRQALSEIG